MVSLYTNHESKNEKKLSELAPKQRPPLQLTQPDFELPFLSTSLSPLCVAGAGLPMLPGGERELN
jgi:hypothetical protein